MFSKFPPASLAPPSSVGRGWRAVVLFSLVGRRHVCNFHQQGGCSRPVGVSRPVQSGAARGLSHKPQIMSLNAQHNRLKNLPGLHVLSLSRLVFQP